MISILAFMIFMQGGKITSFGQQNNNSNNPNSKSHDSLRNDEALTNVIDNLKHNDSTPSVNITYPSYPPTVLSGNITIKGIANDSNGIKAISADAQTFPFNGSMPIKPASIPSLITEGNRSKWSIPFAFNNSGVYRIVVTVRDNANNLGYAETTVNVVPLNGTLSNSIEGKEPRISFVRPTFTEAAYQEHGFYRFYFKYGFPPIGKNITTDLDMLTVKTPRSVAEFLDENNLRSLTNVTALIPLNGTELHDVSYDFFPNPQKFWTPFINHVKKVAPNSTLTVMRDEDVHDGHILYGDNKTNAYDILILFHNEYVTQSEYDNLRQFVKNGGSIVFIDANVFYAEVSYDRDNHTITLVKGHSWQFDGKTAKRSPSERWYNETKEWVGGNFLVNDIETNIIFTNNLFNYTHFEEQYVNNPNVKIINDYGIKFPNDYIKVYSVKSELPIDKKLEDVIVATYALEYGKGNVIVSGLTGRLLADNQQFMNFFEDVMLSKALCPKFQSCYLS